MAWLNFLDLRSLPVKEAEAVILPIPYEATTTYGAGTRQGPEAILAASRQVELWDEDYDWDPSAAIRLATAAPILPEVSGPQAMVEKIKRIVQPWIAQGKLICALGGEHTITVALLQAMQTRYPDLTVVALDAHADMRESYDGSKLSHACVMRRAYELGRPLTLLGVRSYSQDEYQARPTRLFIIYEWADRPMKDCFEKFWVSGAHRAPLPTHWRARRPAPPDFACFTGGPTAPARMSPGMGNLTDYNSYSA